MKNLSRAAKKRRNKSSKPPGPARKSRRKAIACSPNTHIARSARPPAPAPSHGKHRSASESRVCNGIAGRHKANLSPACRTGASTVAGEQATADEGNEKRVSRYEENQALLKILYRPPKPAGRLGIHRRRASALARRRRSRIASRWRRRRRRWATSN